MPSTFFLRENISSVTPYSPGLSIDEIQSAYGLDNVIKLASNENPLGTSRYVQEKVTEATKTIFRYAQSGNPKLRKAIAQFYKLNEENIVLGNGSGEIIDLLIRACPTPQKHNIVSCLPCFSLYTLQAEIAGVSHKQVPLQKDFSFNWSALLESIDENTALVFLTTPDNPSGYCPSKNEILSFYQQLPSSCLLVVDEAYMDFSLDEEKSSFLYSFSDEENIVVLRTFSKSFGLAGIRLGFALMPHKLAQSLCSIRLPFSINILAEAAGLAALEDTAFRKETLNTIWKEKDYLTEQLSELACQVYPSSANFLMFSLPHNFKYSAQETFQKLLELGVIVRSLHSYGLPHNLRVTISNREENNFFLTKLKQVLAHD